MLQAFNQLFSSPGQAGFQAAGTTAGTQYGNAGTASTAAAAPLNTAGQSLLPYAQQVMAMGLDPNQTLYNQNLLNTTSLANVNNAQYGLTGQQAAGNTTQAQTNFNADWQSQQLQNAIAGLSAGSSAINQAGNTATAASALGSAGANQTLQSGAVPYATSQAIGQGQESALATYLQQLLAPITDQQSTIGNDQNYLNTGVSASEGAANAAVQDYAAQTAASGDLGSALGSLLGMGTSIYNTNTIATALAS